MKAIIFDLYDTLIYSSVKLKPYKKFFLNAGLTLEELNDCVNMVMIKEFKNFEELKNRIKPDLKVDLSVFENDLKEELESTVLFDDTLEVLEQLSKKYELFLFSNLATPYKQPFYSLGLDAYIKNPYFSCEIGYKKPDLNGYDYVASEIEKLTGIEKKDLLMVGDNKVSDFQGAQNAGIKARLKDKDLSFILNDLF